MSASASVRLVGAATVLDAVIAVVVAVVFASRRATAIIPFLVAFMSMSCRVTNKSLNATRAFFVSTCKPL